MKYNICKEIFLHSKTIFILYFLSMCLYFFLRICNYNACQIYYIFNDFPLQ